MTYGYYPGCALERNARSYHVSTMAIAEPLGLVFEEVDDWNCCGATEYVTVDLLPAYALVARNLALAAGARNGQAVRDLVAPCSACFVNLRKTDRYMQTSPSLAKDVNDALAAGDLNYRPGSVRSRHLLDVIVHDVGLEAVADQVKNPLYGMRIAPYYGCLIVRPGESVPEDDPEYPTGLDRLLTALGADVADYPLKAHCCGGHMTQISRDVALGLLHALLKNAAETEADAIVTLCPMCQLNLDAYQEQVNEHFGTSFRMPILYFTQLMGLAFGLAPETLGFGSEFVDATPALEKIVDKAPKKRPDKQDKDALPMPGTMEEAL